MDSVLVTGGIYHIFTRSIEDLRIFNNRNEFLRIYQALQYYQISKQKLRFACWEKHEHKENGKNPHHNISPGNANVAILAYCIMPEHVHLILKQLKDNGISNFMSNALNSYTRYFNVKYHRRGTLWEGRFKRIIVLKDEYLLHLTRYIHLNPVTAYLVDRPEDWEFSSYREYIGQIDASHSICNYKDVLDITPEFYYKFACDRIDYQRKLAEIKYLVNAVTPRRCIKLNYTYEV